MHRPPLKPTGENKSKLKQMEVNGDVDGSGGGLAFTPQQGVQIFETTNPNHQLGRGNLMVSSSDKPVSWGSSHH